MRTTINLEDDVVALLERVRKAHGAALKDVVNEAMRRGLREMTAQPVPRRAFRTRSVDLGRCLAGNLDNVSEALALAEGESFRHAG
jgi:hypothetical protein